LNARAPILGDVSEPLDLFDREILPPSVAATRRGPGAVLPAEPSPDAPALAAALGPRVRLGTSSWSFPGWAGLVYSREVGATALARHGLPAYAAHPLLRTVSLDRAFYRPLAVAEYAALARQVPEDFRFVVKASAEVCDAALREPGSGRALQDNPRFLDPATTLATVLQPAVEGLGRQLGALVFQLSPLPRAWLDAPERLLGALARLFESLPRPAHGLLALELRDAEPLTPALAALLRAHGVRYCLGLHDRMPPLADQLPMLRATWPGPLVCRWNLQRGLRYGAAKARFEPFDKLVAPDPATREALAGLIAATAGAGQPVLVTVNNKAEGSAPGSVFALAAAIAAQAGARR
jgi:uncharacterized protein YecE (DUF72 family)